MDHLLLHYKETHILWTLLLTLFGVHVVIPKSMKEALRAWYSLAVKKGRKPWIVAPSCLSWIEWKKRNSITFENNQLL